MNHGEDAVPLDNANFNERAGLIRTDEHRHPVVLHEMANRKAKGMQDRTIRDTVPEGTVEDERIRLHRPCLLTARKLVKMCAARLVTTADDVAGVLGVLRGLHRSTEPVAGGV